MDVVDVGEVDVVNLFKCASCSDWSTSAARDFHDRFGQIFGPSFLRAPLGMKSVCNSIRLTFVFGVSFILVWPVESMSRHSDGFDLHLDAFLGDSDSCVPHQFRLVGSYD